jgi:hypothetical protein
MKSSLVRSTATPCTTGAACAAAASTLAKASAHLIGLRGGVTVTVRLRAWARVRARARAGLVARGGE